MRKERPGEKRRRGQEYERKSGRKHSKRGPVRKSLCCQLQTVRQASKALAEMEKSDHQT